MVLPRSAKDFLEQDLSLTLPTAQFLLGGFKLMQSLGRWLFFKVLSFSTRKNTSPIDCTQFRGVWSVILLCNLVNPSMVLATWWLNGGKAPQLWSTVGLKNPTRRLPIPASYCWWQPELQPKHQLRLFCISQVGDFWTINSSQLQLCATLILSVPPRYPRADQGIIHLNDPISVIFSFR